MIVAVVFGLCLSVVSSAGLERLDQTTLQVWFFDVGQGDATFIVTPNGKQILVDAGPGNAVLSKLGSVMPFWDRSLDAIIITHPDADHITGFVSVLERYRVDEIFETGADASTAVARAFDQSVEQEDAEKKYVHTGERFIIDHVQFDVLWPQTMLDHELVQDRNDASVVLLMTYGETTLLLTGDAEEMAEEEYSRDLLHVDVLKVGHHGSVSSTTTQLLSAITPTVAVISCGDNNRYGHPHPIILERLSSIDSDIFRTDQSGDILLSSQGGEPRVRAYSLIF